jgi:2-polyprenyl-3-methyl-5-hydroxy-6-metoxy-1,4-benzoquinol methylase
MLEFRDQSNGYEEFAEAFFRARDSRIGAAEVREWSKTLPLGCSVLDLGCGHGIPVSRVLIDAGFTVYGVDASPTMIAAFRERCPEAHSECSTIDRSEFLAGSYHGIVAWGLMFLLPEESQASIIRRASRALNPGGRFLFTAPREAVAWNDAITGRQSISLGAEAYERLLRAEDLILAGEQVDRGGNHYYVVSKPGRGTLVPTADVVPRTR